jgi:hypothetical protein
MKETARVSVMCHKSMQGVSFARKTGGSPPLVPEAISCLPKVLSLDAPKTKMGLFRISVVYSFFDKYEEVTFWLQYT